eukprot:scaffold12817_cov75-Phaeocystis_antarctica.AAC.6
MQGWTARGAHLLGRHPDGSSNSAGLRAPIDREVAAYIDDADLLLLCSARAPYSQRSARVCTCTGVEYEPYSG